MSVPWELQDKLFTVRPGVRNRVDVMADRQVRGVKTPRVFYTIDGGKGAHWDMPNNDIDSVVHTLMERVYYVKLNGQFQSPPTPDEGYVVRKLTRYSYHMDRCARAHGKVPPLTDEQYLDKFGGQKREINARAMESHRTRPFEAKDGRVRIFTKDEFRKLGGAPRGIQHRGPRFNVRFGRYVCAVEEHTYKAIDQIFDPSGNSRTVAKGMNMLERGEAIAGKWAKHSDPIAIAIDAKRFDQHVREVMLKFEHSIYKQWLDLGARDDLEPFDKLAKYQLVNRGRYYGKDGKIKYTVRGCRMSGDVNTSSGNINIMCALLWTYIRDCELLGKVDVLNDGDDSVIITDRRYADTFLDDMDAWFSKMGFTMTLDGIYYNLEDIEFCQAKPVKMAYGWMLVPRPTKRLYSDLTTTKPIHSKKVYEKWLGAVAGCGIAGSYGVPVFGEFYSWLARGANPYIPKPGSIYYRYRMELVNGLEIKTREPEFEERISFYFATGITPDAQMMLEKYYKNKPDPTYTLPERNIIPGLDAMQYVAPPEMADRYQDLVV